MSETIEISHLREHPEWVSQVAVWHHREWLRGFREGQLHKPGFERGEDIREREHNLRSHFGAEAVPATYIAHIPNAEPNALLGDTRIPIGSVSLVAYQFTQGRKPSEWVTNLYVEPEYRKKGIGQQLLAFIEDYALQHQLDLLRLYTRDKAEYYTKRNWTFKHNGMVQGNAVAVFEKYLGGAFGADEPRPASEA
ncbi:acetyltransferase (GNAT) family protein [Alteromonadaceae bacterium 2753L.S.0a.02]|nr:acetyltransferase (GNAT) family protein [Alteromonadaceae bacterium 2753L.S.0a.02]